MGGRRLGVSAAASLRTSVVALRATGGPDRSGRVVVSTSPTRWPDHRGASGADKSGTGGERQTQEKRQGDSCTVEQAFEGCKLGERHDKIPYGFGWPPGRGGVRSARCLDSSYLNGVNIIFTAFG